MRYQVFCMMLLLTMISLFNGCHGSDNLSVSTDLPQREGLILVSEPQIYARETLVDDRRREVEYLEKQLEDSATAEFAPQFRRDLQTISSFAAQLGLSFDPLKGVEAARQKETGDLQHQIALADLRLRLLDLEGRLSKKQREIESGELGESKPSGEKATEDKVQATPSPTAPDMANLKALADGLAEMIKDLRTALAQNTPEIRATAVTASPEETFIDRQAFRQQIRNALSEVNLDDSHDAYGRSLYKLQYRATVFPEKERNRFGAVDMHVLPPQITVQKLETLYGRWLAHLTGRLNEHSGHFEEDEALRLAYETLGNARQLFSIYEVSVAPSEGAKAKAEKTKGKEEKKGNEEKAKEKQEKRKEEKAKEEKAKGKDEMVSTEKVPLSKSEETTRKPVTSPNLTVNSRSRCPIDDFSMDESQHCDETIIFPLAIPGIYKFALSQFIFYKNTTATSPISEYVREVTLRLNKASSEGGQALRDRNVFLDSYFENTGLCEKDGPNVNEKAYPPITVVHYLNMLIEISKGPIANAVQSLMKARSGGRVETRRTREAAVKISQHFDGLVKDAHDLITYIRGRGQKRGDKPRICGDETFPMVSFSTTFATSLVDDYDKDPAYLATWTPNNSDQPTWKVAGAPMVYATNPTEMADRVSTLDSAASALQTALSIAALVPKSGLAVETQTAYAKQVLKRMEGRERMPIVVSYSSFYREGLVDKDNKGNKGNPKAQPARRETPRTVRADATENGFVTGSKGTEYGATQAEDAAEFGWILGPHVAMDPNRHTLSLEQRLTNLPLSVELAVPSWWDEIYLQVNTAWVNDWTWENTPSWWEFWKEKTGHRRVLDHKSSLQDSLHRVELPTNRADLDGLTNFIARKLDASSTERVTVTQVHPAIVSACANGDLVFQIMGIGIWRAERAFLAGMSHKTIRVLPGMEGVEVTFDFTKLPRRPNGQSTVDLFVTTRRGGASYPIKVTGSRFDSEACGKELTSPPPKDAKLEPGTKRPTIDNFLPKIIAGSAKEATFVIQGEDLVGTTFFFGNVQASKTTSLDETGTYYQVEFKGGPFAKSGGKNVFLHAINRNGEASAIPAVEIQCEGQCPGIIEPDSFQVSWNDRHLTNLPVCEPTISLQVSGASSEKITTGELQIRVGATTHTRQARDIVHSRATGTINVVFDGFSTEKDFENVKVVILKLGPMEFTRELPAACTKKEEVN